MGQQLLIFDFISDFKIKFYYLPFLFFILAKWWHITKAWLSNLNYIIYNVKATITCFISELGTNGKPKKRSIHHVETLGNCSVHSSHQYHKLWFSAVLLIPISTSFLSLCGHFTAPHWPTLVRWDCWWLYLSLTCAPSMRPLLTAVILEKQESSCRCRLKSICYCY